MSNVLDGYSVLPIEEANSLTPQELTDHYLHSLGKVMVDTGTGPYMDLATYARLLPSRLLENSLRNANSSLEQNLREEKNSLAVGAQLGESVLSVSENVDTNRALSTDTIICNALIPWLD